jgi:starch synthase
LKKQHDKTLNLKNNPSIKSIFTIHNLQYQGVFDKKIANRILLDENDINELEFYNKINFMKSGLIYSDVITTVSLSYAQEIQTPKYGYGLEGILLQRKNALVGILNGIDYTKYEFLENNNVSSSGNKNIIDKKINKVELCRDFNILLDDNMPVIGMVSRFAEQKGFDILYDALEEIMSLKLVLIILGMGDIRLEEMFRDAQKRFHNNLRVDIGFNDELAKKIYIGSDIFLMPSQFEPCGLSQIISMRYGTIPVARRTGGLNDTINDFTNYDVLSTGNEELEKTNGFLFDEYSSHALINTLKKAISFYSNKNVWQRIIHNAMQCNYSWDESAKKYIELYKNLLHCNN